VIRRRTRWTESLQTRLDDRKATLELYREAEKAILSGNKPYSYTIGPRNKTNYNMSLAQLREAIKSIEEEIDSLENAQAGIGSSRTRAVVPRDV
jgi:hypothetical protein